MIRIGHSRDIHRLTKGKALVLGGISIPAAYSAVGHSDADCLLHAIGEAILGALALGDLGSHFPESDPANKDKDSKTILSSIVGMMKEKGFSLVNLDATVHLEAPKLSPFINDMRKTIAALVDSDIAQVSLKATTGETVGPIGRGEAIEAECAVLLEQRRRIQPL